MWDGHGVGGEWFGQPCLLAHRNFLDFPTFAAKRQCVTVSETDHLLIHTGMGNSCVLLETA